VSPQAIQLKVENDRATVSLHGEHEAYTADKLAKHLSGLLDEGVGVTIDLRRTAFIDSTVVGVLLAARRRAKERGLAFELLLGPTTGWPVRRMLEVIGLADSADAPAFD
jgi:anti-anti-sigma factor